MIPSQDDFTDFLQHLTDNAKASLQNADSISRSMTSAFIGTEHILLGVLGQDSSVGAKILSTSGVTLERARTVLNLTPKALIVSTGSKGLSETAKMTLRLSWDVAQEFGQDYCGTEHILYSILSQKNARATVLLRDMKVDLGALVAETEQYLNRQSDHQAGHIRNKRRRKGKTLLDFFGIDLTDKARAGELDPVIGREDQIRRMVTILGRRNKNNPVLLGEPGVGKTAIIEGLAQRIVAEEVPEHLLDKRVVTLDLAAMIAGTKYRGEFEERLKKLISELTESNNYIVFIDELHLLVGAGAAEGAVDAANMLKPALARGKLQLIGATTLDEYRRHIEKDAALERRFQTIIVPEPSPKETIAILRGLKKHYEKHHGVEVSDDVLVDIVSLAKRYINDRFMPDKAIDILDEAAARVKIERGKIPMEERKYSTELKAVTERMESAVEAEDYERAAQYKTRMSQLNEKLQAIRSAKDGRAKLTLTVEDIAQTVSVMSGVPVQKVLRSEANRLLVLEKRLTKNIIGQAEAVGAVSRAIRRNRSGITDGKRPIGSFIFMGPTGVGKTELARVLAQEVFGSKEALIKIDMSEMSEKHMASRLVGAPAGYVGYEDGNQLTDKIKRNPYSLVLFDEIEKAHPDVLNILLQVLEDGVLTDGKGKKVDFTNTVIIITSNLGAKKMQQESALGFQIRGSKQTSELSELHAQNKEAALKDLKNFMRPELLNRLDKVVVFQALTKKEVGQILDLQLQELNRRLGRMAVGVDVLPSAKKLLLAKGYDPHNGVRPLKRAIQDMVEDEIADGLLAERYTKGDIVCVAAEKDKLIFEIIAG